MASRKRRLSNDADINVLHKEWDEASCPICMDHPHNAVLIVCSSHEKGCISYICDTSYRHSNCLDRFKKLFSESEDNSGSHSPPSLRTSDRSNLVGVSYERGGIVPDSVEILRGQGENTIHTASRHLETQEGNLEIGNSNSMRGSRSSLKCPLCRGSVLGYKVVEEVRQYLNLKRRSCSREMCSFSGNYRELRSHARWAHPTVRPSDIDPSRERAWRRLEHQREYGDIVSAIRSAMPGAVVFGDYAIDNADRVPAAERERGSGQGNSGHWLSAYFLLEFIGSIAPERRGGRSRVPRHRRHPLRGENSLGLQDEDVEEEVEFHLNILSDTGEDPDPTPDPARRRTRLRRYRSDEDRS